MATGSMDTTAKLWNIQTGTEACTLAVSGESLMFFDVCKCVCFIAFWHLRDILRR